MRRFYPFILIIIFVVMVIGGIVQFVIETKECARSGSTMVAPFTRGQFCNGW